jgi:hypothetical protein
MKLCLITNYVNKGYIEETLILNQLISTLDLSPEDIIEFKDENKVYFVNQNYTHALILLDYEITSYQYIKHFLSELEIPKVFIIDSIPDIEKELNNEFIDKYSLEKDYVFSTLEHNEWAQLYSLADAVIFYNQIDFQIFTERYKTNLIPTNVIPPSLGKLENLKPKLENIIKNNNIGYNGTPSYSRGIFHWEFLNKNILDCNFNIYGSHGKNGIKNQNVTNYLTDTYSNINFYGKLKNYDKFYLNNFIYYDCPLYNPFSYNMYLSLINGVIPILSHNTSSTTYLTNYPFTIEYCNLEQFTNLVKEIQQTPSSQLRNIISEAVNNISWMNDTYCKNEYYTFIKNYV